MSGFSSRVPDFRWQVIRDRVEKNSTFIILDANLKPISDVPIPTEACVGPRSVLN